MKLKDILLPIICLVAGLYLGFSLNKSLSIHETTSFNETTVIFPLVAVTSEGKGVLEYATLKIIPGSGKAFISINPFVEPDTQYAFENAIHAACKLAKRDCSKYNFILEIHSKAKLVGGPSAGLAFALAVYYGLLNKSFPKFIAVTGTIDSNGNIGQVGGIFEKALAAAQSGKKLFIVPPGQGIVYRYEKVEKKYEPFPGFVFVQIEYKPVPVNLSDLFEKKYGMKVIEAKNLEEAIKIIENFSK